MEPSCTGWSPGNPRQENLELANITTDISVETVRVQEAFRHCRAGLGGLATALRLSHRGHQVTVVEMRDTIGGRNQRVKVNECHFDGGASLMMMLEPYKRLFADVGERMEDHLELKLCDPSYRVFFADETTIEGTPNVARMVQQIEDLCGRAEAERYGKLLGDLAELYRLAIPNFVRRNYNSILDLATPASLNIVLKHKMLSNLAKRIEDYVHDPRLRMLFTFQTMYLGLSPFQAPWVYGVLTYHGIRRGYLVSERRNGANSRVCSDISSEKRRANIDRSQSSKD